MATGPGLPQTRCPLVEDNEKGSGLKRIVPLQANQFKCNSATYFIGIEAGELAWRAGG